MTERTINLRDRESRTDWDIPIQARTNTEKERSNQVSVPQAKKPLLEWAAAENMARERGPYWYLSPAGIALIFIIFGILIQSWFFVAFVVMALLAILLYARRPGREYRFVVTSEGILTGESLHRFSEMQSFWIFDAADHRELSVETSRRLHPYLRLPLGEANPNKIRGALSQYLPEKEHKDFFTDQIARSVGF